MQIVKRCKEKCAICLGNFDGLHWAHTEIINSCKKFADKNNLKSGMLLFDRHTSEIFGENTKLLTTQDEKLHILEGLGLDFLYIMHFDESVANKEGKEFIKDLLSDFNVSAFFVGYDYAFGKGAEYKASDLENMGRELGFSTFITKCKSIDDTAISSTLIRELVKSGDVKGASEILGRAYFILAPVKKGLGNGKKFLFPTANLETCENKLLPADGVYKAIATVSGERFRSVVNVGMNPTFDAEKRTVEAHLIDFSGDLYGQKIKVEFIEKIRDDIKFESVENLKKQINEDIKKVKDLRL